MSARQGHRTVAVLTLGCGAVGVAMALALSPARGSAIEVVLCSGVIAICAWGVWCGVRLLEQQPGAECAASRYWLVQGPSFGSPFVGHFLSSSVHLTLSLQFAPLMANAYFLPGSIFIYTPMQPGTPWLVGVNVFALAIACRPARCVPPVAR